MKAAKDLKDFVRSATASRFEKFEEKLKAVADGAKDPDAIHDLRVSIRRFVQCLRIFADWFDARRVRKIRQRLKKLIDHCGAARNCDIAIELLEDAKLPGNVVVADLREKRQDAEHELIDYLARWTTRGHHDDWLKELKPAMPGARSGWKPKATSADSASRILPRMAKELFAAGAAAADPKATHEEMHEFRLLGKRFRYAFEIFEPVYGAEMEQRVKSLKELQDHLGKINDCVTSLPLVRKYPKARAAIEKTLGKREREFRTYWSSSWGAEAVRDWRQWLKAAPLAKATTKENNGNLHPATRGGTAPPRRTSGQRSKADAKGKRRR